MLRLLYVFLSWRWDGKEIIWLGWGGEFKFKGSCEDCGANQAGPPVAPYSSTDVIPAEDHGEGLQNYTE